MQEKAEKKVRNQRGSQGKINKIPQNLMEAKLKYLQNKFEEIQGGFYVTCAVTGEMIDLENLRYWSVKRQEPYKDAATSLKKELKIKNATSSV